MLFEKYITSVATFTIKATIAIILLTFWGILVYIALKLIGVV